MGYLIAFLMEINTRFSAFCKWLFFQSTKCHYFLRPTISAGPKKDRKKNEQCNVLLRRQRKRESWREKVYVSEGNEGMSDPCKWTEIRSDASLTVTVAARKHSSLPRAVPRGIHGGLLIISRSQQGVLFNRWVSNSHPPLRPQGLWVMLRMALL